MQENYQERFPHDKKHNPHMAATEEEKILPAQINQINALARGAKFDADEVAVQIYGAPVRELNRKAAERLMWHLKNASIPPKEVFV